MYTHVTVALPGKPTDETNDNLANLRPIQKLEKKSRDYGPYILPET